MTDNDQPVPHPHDPDTWLAHTHKAAVTLMMRTECPMWALFMARDLAAAGAVIEVDLRGMAVFRLATYIDNIFDNVAFWVIDRPQQEAIELAVRSFALQVDRCPPEKIEPVLKVLNEQLTLLAKEEGEWKTLALRSW